MIRQEAQLSQCDIIIRPFNELSDGASHVHINTAVSEIQRLAHNAIARVH